MTPITRPRCGKRKSGISLPEGPPTVFPGRCLTPSPLCSGDDECHRFRRYQRILHARHSFFLAAPFLLFAMDAFPFHGRRHFVFLRRAVFRCGKKAASSGTTRRYNTSCACPTLAFKRNMDEKFVTSISPCRNASEKILCLSALTPSSPKTQPCAHISWTRATGLSREASPYDLIWGIGYRVGHVSARQPPLWRGLIVLGKTLQAVRRLFRDRAPPPTHHQFLSPQGTSTSSRAVSYTHLTLPTICSV